MRMNVVKEIDVPMKELASVLSNCDPEEFAEFWFEFYTEINDNDETLDKFAKAMAASLGGGRKQVFKKLNELIAYHEINSDRGRYETI